MAWYNTGTVTATLNSATVTGSGTAFLTNVRIGDGITIAGSTSVHEVTNVATDTSLTITPVFPGATGSGKAYSIIPVQGYTKSLADQARTLLLTFDTIAGSTSVNALAGTTGTANVIPYFTSGTAMATTPLTAVARTLLDDATVAAMRTTLGLKTAAIADVVGTVASGAIMEYGSNANGMYIRYQDGTMICWKNYTSAIPMNPSAPGLYIGVLAGHPLPSTFYGSYSGTWGGVDSSAAGWGSLYPTAASSCHLYYFSPAATHTTTLLSLVAVGRWKA